MFELAHSLHVLRKRLAGRRRAKILVEYVNYRWRGTKPILFDHVPKCGGTTVTEYLCANYPERRIFRTGPDHFADVARFRQFPEKVRQGYSLVLGHECHDLIDVAKPGTVVATLLREPVDRVVSRYYYIRQNPKHRLHRAMHDEVVSLETFAKSSNFPRSYNWYTCHFSGWTEDEVARSPKEAVDVALATLERDYHVIGILKNLDAFLDALAEAAHLAPPPRGKVANKTLKRKALDEISAEARANLEAANLCDIELYRQVLARWPEPTNTRVKRM